MESEDLELMADGLAIVGSFNMADMQRSRRALLFWLHLGELDGLTGRRMRDFTRSHLAHAGRAYAAAQYLADEGLISAPPGWETSGLIRLTRRGRECLERYEGNVSLYVETNRPATGDIKIEIGGNVAGSAISGAGDSSVSDSNNVQPAVLDHADLVAVLGRIRPYLSSFPGGGGLVDELQQQAVAEEDTPELRSSMWERIQQTLIANGMDRVIDIFASAFGS
ncbi:hypothetical protein HEK616_84210 (plasmid) [Streptomyces nigrescens]|uniref:Uncharacterized protein n=1 Tax=Streptomyces nigrescens TaxID=1920 RepID=A0ABN6R985_STRNI|nr:hypothetical protein [Streptomyces nigrescens]BDM74934.1 hypothetical protein HEK616_84210 [Streptomyces nigrescens]